LRLVSRRGVKWPLHLLARLELTARTLDKIRDEGELQAIDQVKIDAAIATVRAEHELERAALFRQGAAVMAGAPRLPIDPAQA
jgi:hypothetical protein